MQNKVLLNCSITLWIIIISPLAFLLGCSTDNFVNKIKLWDESIRYGDVANNDVERFISSVRPAYGNPDSHYLLATYYHERGRHKDAIEEFKKIISIDPLYVKAYNGVGVSFDKLGHTYRAIDYYKKALSLNPELDYVQNNLGFAYVRIGQYDKAIDALKKALQLRDDRRFHNNLGLAYARMGRFEEAFIEFKRGGNEVNAHFNMGKVYYEKGLYQEAKTHFMKVIHFDPSSTIARSWIDSADSRAAMNHSSDAVSETNNKPDDRTVPLVNDEKGSMVKRKSSQSSDKFNERQLIKNKVSYEGIGLEISNGNGVNGMARRLGGFLSEKGFDVVRLTNADNFNHPETIVYYRGGHLITAYELSKNIPGSYHLHKVRQFDRSNIDIRVLIGKDIIKHDNTFVGG